MTPSFHEAINHLGKHDPFLATVIADTYKWDPYESIASWYIWQSLENAPKL